MGSVIVSSYCTLRVAEIMAQCSLEWVSLLRGQKGRCVIEKCPLIFPQVLVKKFSE